MSPAAAVSPTSWREELNFYSRRTKSIISSEKASISGPGKVVYKTKENREETLDSENILVSTGAVSRDLPGLTTNGKTVLNVTMQ